MNEKKLKVYGTSWCPDTARSRKCLVRNGVNYDFCDIEQDKVGLAYVEKVNRGQRSVPTIVFPDGSVLVEPSDEELTTKLKASGCI